MLPCLFLGLQEGKGLNRWLVSYETRSDDRIEYGGTATQRVVVSNLRTCRSCCNGPFEILNNFLRGCRRQTSIVIECVCCVFLFLFFFFFFSLILIDHLIVNNSCTIVYIIVHDQMLTWRCCRSRSLKKILRLACLLILYCLFCRFLDVYRDG